MLYPRVLRAATARRRHLALRARDRRARAAQDEPRGAVGHAAPRRASRAASASRTASRCRRRASSSATWSAATRRRAAIAAASVIAKVTRDRFMQRMEERYPGWEFAAHVGYSTPEHRAAIEKLGVSPLHRMSFQSMAYQQLAL